MFLVTEGNSYPKPFAAVVELLLWLLDNVIRVCGVDYVLFCLAIVWLEFHPPRLSLLFTRNKLLNHPVEINLIPVAGSRHDCFDILNWTTWLRHRLNSVPKIAVNVTCK